MMQVEDERRHADQYKEQVLSKDEQSDTIGKLKLYCAWSFCQLSTIYHHLPSVSPRLHLPVRWRKPTLVWSSWNASWKRRRRKPPGPTPPAGSCRGSWTTPRRPARASPERSTPSRIASGAKRTLLNLGPQNPRSLTQRKWKWTWTGSANKAR